MAAKGPVYHPVATGAARATVDIYTEKQDLILWAGWFCPFTQRSWIVLEEKNIPYTYRETNPYLKEPEYIAISPGGLGPAIQHHGKPLHDSMLSSPEGIERATALNELQSALAEISAHRQGPYFFGEEFSLVDAAIAPWAVRDFIISEYRGFSREDIPDWKDWAEKLESRASVVKTSSDRDKYVEFNGTFLRNEGHSLAGKAASQGQPIP